MKLKLKLKLKSTSFGRLITAPILRYPDFSKPFWVETDASKEAVAAVLAQKDSKGKLRPIGYVSRTTSIYEKNYTVTELECLALVYGMKQFRCYLFQHQVTVVTDHGALTHLQKAHTLPARLQRWALSIQEINPLIVYRKGKANANADALSCRYRDEFGTTDWTAEDEFQLKGLSLTDSIKGQKYLDFIEEIETDPVQSYVS